MTLFAADTNCGHFVILNEVKNPKLLGWLRFQGCFAPLSMTWMASYSSLSTKQTGTAVLSTLFPAASNATTLNV